MRRADARRVPKKQMIALFRQHIQCLCRRDVAVKDGGFAGLAGCLKYLLASPGQRTSTMTASKIERSAGVTSRTMSCSCLS